MTKKKSTAHRRPRRLSSYERALRDAEQRLEKAIQERTDCLMKLDALAREIPYLEEIVRALTPQPDTSLRPLAPADVYPGHQPPPPPLTSSTAEDVQAKLQASQLDQAQFLQRFMPRPGRLTTPVGPPQPQQPQPGSSPDPDEFLTADNDRGYEVLP